VNGKSVVISSAGLISGPAPIVDEEAGTITFLTSFKGLPEKIQWLDAGERPADDEPPPGSSQSPRRVA
jgi:hypothetical protein